MAAAATIATATIAARPKDADSAISPTLESKTDDEPWTAERLRAVYVALNDLEYAPHVRGARERLARLRVDVRHHADLVRLVMGVQGSDTVAPLDSSPVATIPPELYVLAGQVEARVHADYDRAQDALDTACRQALPDWRTDDTPAAFRLRYRAGAETARDAKQKAELRAYSVRWEHRPVLLNDMRAAGVALPPPPPPKELAHDNKEAKLIYRRLPCCDGLWVNACNVRDLYVQAGKLDQLPPWFAAAYVEVLKAK